MGFFSWKCAVSGENVANIYSGHPNFQAYLVTPERVLYEPAYKGYGVFDGEDVHELLGDGDRYLGIDRYFDYPDMLPFKIKVVLKQHYTGQSYEELPESELCEYQGYFFD